MNADVFNLKEDYMFFIAIIVFCMQVNVGFAGRIHPHKMTFEPRVNYPVDMSTLHKVVPVINMIFPSKCAWKACFPILLAQGEIPVSRSMHPLRWLPLSRQKHQTRGEPALHLNQARGYLIWRMGLLHYWVVVWVAGYFNFHLYCLHGLWGVSKAEYILALRSHSVLDILLPAIITIMQDYSQALNTYKWLQNIWCVDAASPIDWSPFYYYWNIWFCMC